MNRFNELYEKVLRDLEKNLPKFLTYHDLIHTKLVLEKAIFLGKKEQISANELLLLKIAALYHDTGYMVSNENHEIESCRIAERDLPDFGFNSLEIGQICKMIMATKIPQQPQTALEEILADADLEYLGTDEYDFINQKLFLEAQHFRLDLTEKDWLEIQVDFFSNHHYHTEFCIRNREPKKAENLQKIKERLQLISSTTQ